MAIKQSLQPDDGFKDPAAQVTLAAEDKAELAKIEAALEAVGKYGGDKDTLAKLEKEKQANLKSWNPFKKNV